MYHCHLQIYLISRQPDGFAAIRDMAPMEFFTHTFFESSEPQQALAARADLILADLQGMDAACETEKLAAWKKPEADLVVLAGKGIGGLPFADRLSLDPASFTRGNEFPLSSLAAEL